MVQVSSESKSVFPRLRNSPFRISRCLFCNFQFSKCFQSGATSTSESKMQTVQHWAKLGSCAGWRYGRWKPPLPGVARLRSVADPPPSIGPLGLPKWSWASEHFKCEALAQILRRVLPPFPNFWCFSRETSFLFRWRCSCCCAPSLPWSVRLTMAWDGLHPWDGDRGICMEQMWIWVELHRIYYKHTNTQKNTFTYVLGWRTALNDIQTIQYESI